MRDRDLDSVATALAVGLVAVGAELVTTHAIERGVRAEWEKGSGCDSMGARRRLRAATEEAFREAMPIMRLDALQLRLAVPGRAERPLWRSTTSR